MEKYFGKLIEDYDKALIEELGEGKLKTNLVDGLKSVLNVYVKHTIIKNYEESLKQELGDGDFKKRIKSRLENLLNEKSKNNLLDKFIDYDSMLKNVKNDGFSTRIKNVLRVSNIETYKDFQEACSDYFMHDSRSRHLWKNEKTYISCLHRFRNLGYKGIETIISHLKSVNFDFSEESAKKVAEKNKK